MLLGQSRYAAEVEHQTAEVDRNDAHEARGLVAHGGKFAALEALYLTPSVGQIHIACYRIAVDQNGHRPLVADDFGRGRESKRGDEYGVAPLETQCFDR